MQEYLTYVRKYWSLYNDGYFLGRDLWEVLEELLLITPPHRNWKPDKRDESIIKFGLVYTLYGMVQWPENVPMALSPPVDFVQDPSVIYLGPGKADVD
jgi:hypothetical protein